MVIFILRYVNFLVEKSTNALSTHSEDNTIIKRAERELKRKNQKEDSSKDKRSKKKAQKRRKTVGDKKEKNKSSSELSESDKQLLDRWKNMQMTTKPFIHPIRKYMSDIKTLKEQEQDEKEPKRNLDEGAHDNETTNSGVQYQFTNYVSEKGEGESLKAVKEPAVPDRGKCPAVIFPETLLGRCGFLLA